MNLHREADAGQGSGGNQKAAIELMGTYPYKGNLTNDEWKELVALEYVLTWNYSENPDQDEKRYKELSARKWAFIEGYQFSLQKKDEEIRRSKEMWINQFDLGVNYVKQINQLQQEIERLNQLVKDYEDCNESHNTLVRELDTIMYGENAAHFAALCDLVKMAKTWHTIEDIETAISDTFIPASKYEQILYNLKKNKEGTA